MRRISNMTAFLIGTILLFANCSKPVKKCTIKGKLIGTNSESVVLLKAGGDLRFEGLEIPVKDSLFEYELSITHSEGYQLFLGEAKKRGGGRPMTLFLEPGEINICIYPEDDFDKNTVDGGDLNAEYKKYQDELETRFMSRLTPLNDSTKLLMQDNNFLTDTMKAVYEELRAAKSHDEKLIIYKKAEELKSSGKDLTDAAKKIKDKKKEIYNDAMEWEQAYISNNPSIVSYFLLFIDVLYRKDIIDLAEAKRSFNKLSKKFPNHPYNEALGNILGSSQNIKVGGKYIDFSAPDLNGKDVKISDEIDGKIALIDFWATWCGPCIATSRSMLSVYEQFKDSGFTVIGIAGEFKDTERLKKTLEREKFPWLNLVELDKQNRIWDKYGISNSGGCTFLVDKDGCILAIRPTAEEVKNILSEKLK